MASTLVQKLYLGGLPEGLSMTITDVKPSVPEGTLKSTDWRVSYTEGSGRSSVGISEDFSDGLSGKYPISVATSTANGLIGTVCFRSQNPFTSRGIGGKVDITFRIQGTATASGNTFDQKGFISVSASKWFLTRRPNDVYINYSFIGVPTQLVTLSVPPTISGQPDDLHFVFVLSADGKQIGVSTTQHKEMILKILDGTIETIFFVHGKVLDWVVGLIKFW